MKTQVSTPNPTTTDRWLFAVTGVKKSGDPKRIEFASRNLCWTAEGKPFMSDRVIYWEQPVTWRLDDGTEFPAVVTGKTEEKAGEMLWHEKLAAAGLLEAYLRDGNYFVRAVDKWWDKLPADWEPLSDTPIRA